MRPNWQVYVARELAARAGNTADTHMVGALIVRQLVVLNPGLDTAMLTVPQATQEDYETKGGDENPVLVAALRRMWQTLDVPTTGSKSKAEIADGLWTLARVAFLSLPPQEIEAAKEIAVRSKPLPWWGVTAPKAGEGTREVWGTEESWEDQSAWTDEPPEESAVLSGLASALGSFGGFGRGFGSLRTELLAAVPEDTRAEVTRAFDQLSTDTSMRREFVRTWQEWAKRQGQYDDEIDGLWGPVSETAWIWLLPRSYGRPTTLADVRALTYGGINMMAVVAAAIARDRWVAANPNRLPAPPPPEPEIPGTQPDTIATGETEPTVTTTSVEEEEVIIEPEADMGEVAPPSSEAASVSVPTPDGGVQRVTIVPVETSDAGVPAKRRSRWAGLAMLATAAAVVVGAVVLGNKPKYEEG